MKAVLLSIFTIALISASRVPLQAAPISVLAYGAACDGLTDDTAAFQKAAAEASRIFIATKSPASIVYVRTCVVEGTVNVSSGVHWVGGGTIIVPKQIGPTFYVTDANDVAFTGNTISVVDSGPDSPYNAAIAWFSTASDSAGHQRLGIENNQISGSAWGISVFYVAGSGSLDDVQIYGNSIVSVKPYSNWDAIHVAGKVSNILINANHVSGRGDAAIALTSEQRGTVVQTPTMATISNNVLHDNLVNLDDSGAHDTKWFNNQISTDIPCPGSQSTGFRQIYYFAYPVGAEVHDNNFAPCDNRGTSPAVKIDPKKTGQKSWPDLRSSFTHNSVAGANAPLYVRGVGITIENNTFSSGGIVNLDYDGGDQSGDPGVPTANINFGSNKWLALGSLHLGAGCGLYSKISVEQQSSAKSLSYDNLACVGLKVHDGKISPAKAAR
jgi:hypothetical protein